MKRNAGLKPRMLRPTTPSMKRTVEIFKKSGGFLRTKEALYYGVQPRRLYVMYSLGSVSKVLSKLISPQQIDTP